MVGVGGRGGAGGGCVGVNGAWNKFIERKGCCGGGGGEGGTQVNWGSGCIETIYKEGSE
jgi:hypothetical protein